MFAWRSGAREEVEVKADLSGRRRRRCFAALSSTSSRAELPSCNQWLAVAWASASPRCIWTRTGAGQDCLQLTARWAAGVVARTSNRTMFDRGMFIFAE